MDDLVINSQLTPTIIDNQDTDAPSTIGKRLINSRPQSTLINDRKTLLDLPRLSHGDNTTIVTNIKNTVLLEHRAEHVLHNHRRLGVGHEAGLLMKLLGEKIHSEIAVLTSLRRRCDTNDLARTTLEDQEIADANMVARDGDGIGCNTTLDEANALTHTFADAGWATVIFAIDDDFFTISAVMMWVEWMQDTVCGALKAATEGVVIAVVVVVTHISFRGVDGCFCFDSYFFTRTGANTLVFDVVCRLEALTIVTFGGVDSCGLTIDLNVNLGFWITLVWFSISTTQQSR